MKERLYFYFAVLTHPILVPFVFLLLSSWPVELEIIGLLLVCTVVLPLLVLKFLKINFANPNLKQRREIYVIVGMAYLLFRLLLHFMPSSFNAVMYYWPPIWAVLMFLMFLINFRYKISWHAMVWGHVLALTGLLVGVTAYEDQVLLPAFFRIAIVVILAFLVMRVRYLQKAHSAAELIIGFALGLFLSNLSILLYDSL